MSQIIQFSTASLENQIVTAGNRLEEAIEEKNMQIASQERAATCKNFGKNYCFYTIYGTGCLSCRAYAP